MKYLMKHIAIVAVVVACVAGGYMAYQYFYGSKVEVKIQYHEQHNKTHENSYGTSCHDEFCL